jgi:hypothetical protein
LKFKTDDAANDWYEIFDLEHATAIISDSFWYVICRAFNAGKYPEHEEWFLDRIATNYVSFTLHEIFLKNRKKKEKFFKVYIVNSLLGIL